VKTPYAAPNSVEERPPLIGSEGHTNFQFRPPKLTFRGFSQKHPGWKREAAVHCAGAGHNNKSNQQQQGLLLQTNNLKM
jgi:hypothetical protein